MHVAGQSVYRIRLKQLLLPETTSFWERTEGSNDYFPSSRGGVDQCLFHFWPYLNRSIYMPNNACHRLGRKAKLVEYNVQWANGAPLSAYLLKYPPRLNQSEQDCCSCICRLEEKPDNWSDMVTSVDQGNVMRSKERGGTTHGHAVSRESN